jgi:hypothetical protein
MSVSIKPKRSSSKVLKEPIETPAESAYFDERSSAEHGKTKRFVGRADRRLLISYAL